MGNRALVVFHDEQDYSPTIYLHWDGSRVPELLATWWDRMEGRRNDINYGAARFIGIAHESIDGNLSLGVWNTRGKPSSVDFDDEKHVEYWRGQSHGDAGVFVVNCGTGTVRRVDGSVTECKAPNEFSLAESR